MNQAFFSRILVTEDGVVGWEYQQPFDVLMRIHPPLAGVIGKSQEVTEAGAQAVLSWSLTSLAAAEQGDLARARSCRPQANGPSWCARAGFVGLGSATFGGEGGIRTHGEFPHTRFPSVPIRPLSHPSGYCILVVRTRRR